MTNEEKNRGNFSSLLNSFRRDVPQARQQLSFIELAGQESGENVISNLLAFFFDSRKPHGMRGLVSLCFLRAIGEDVPAGTEVRVKREAKISAGKKKIDMLIETDSLIVGVEHKVHADAYNDFESYSKFLDEFVTQSRHVRKVLLSPRGLMVYPESYGFAPMSYRALLEELSKVLPTILQHGEHPYTGYFLDLYRTMKDHSHRNDEFRNFLHDHVQDYAEFREAESQLEREIRDKLNQLSKILTKFIVKSGCGLRYVTHWIGYVDLPLSRVLFFRIVTSVGGKETQLGYEVEYSSEGWRFLCFTHHEQSSGLSGIPPIDDIHSWTIFTSEEWTKESMKGYYGDVNDHYVLKEGLPYETDLVEVTKSVLSFLGRDASFDSETVAAMQRLIKP